MPGNSSYRVVVVGAGFGGIGMGIALRRAGIEDFLIVDKGDEPGGTWRDNTYPGAACDVPAHLYSFSFRPGRWTSRFPAAGDPGLPARPGRGERPRPASAPRDRRHRVPVRRGPAAWNLILGDGDTIQASAVISAVGQLNRPALPDIAGHADFTGPSWHSARWDHGVGLDGKQVAVVGTGASAIQFVPEIAKAAARVDVYQRTPPYVLPKTDRRYGEGELALYDRFPVVRKADRLRIFLYGELLTSGFVLSPKLLAGPMQLWRRQLSTQITDPGLRAKCVPGYVMGCKRVLFSNDWYPALARPNVDLVTDPIECIVADGVRTADGTIRHADVIVYGTGFKTLDFLAPMEVTGLRGRRLEEAWHDGAEAYLGISVAGFPNFFMLYGPNTNLGGNSILYMLEGQIGYVAAALRALESEGLGWIDVRPEVQQAFNAWVTTSSRTSVWESGCRSWYTTASGRNTNNWPDHTFLYRHRVRRFDLARYRAMPRSPAPAAPGAVRG